jgi:ABC-2 type transport system ATP-binding protein
MIVLNNVTKKYDSEHIAANQISLEIKDGEIVGFIGPNGAGKTTTIKMITGVLDCDEGNILINGYDIEKQPLEAKKQMGIVPDNCDIFLRLKGIEFLNFYCDLYGVSKEDRSTRLTDYAKRFEMEDALNDKILSYSHGMRQKIVIMAVLLCQPSVWILDEPMTGLDPKASFTLKQIMKEHAAQGNTVFFSTHVLEVAERLCDRVAIINHGKIVFIGTLDELKAQYGNKDDLEALFFEVIKHE